MFVLRVHCVLQCIDVGRRIETMLRKSLSLLVLFDVIAFVTGQSAVKYPVSGRLSQSQSAARSAVHYALEEEIESGTPIGHGVGIDSGFIERLEAADEAHVVSSLKYRFLTQPPNYLELDERDGVLRTKGRLDREEICSDENDGVMGVTRGKDNSCQIRIDIAVQPMHYFQIFKVFLTILDINDNDPTFSTNGTRHIEVVESAPIGSRFPLPAATDPDSPRFGVQRYVFAAQTSWSEAVFDLRTDRNPDGSMDVRLVLVRGLDRETRSEYRLTIVAYDGGVPSPRSATCDIVVVVLDVNDNRPTFERSHYETSVVENAPTGTGILRVRATDQDIGTNGAVRYQLASVNYAGMFAVNEATGDISVIGALDYERAAVHHIMVSAVDGDPSGGPEVSLSSDVTVQIRVIDVNDNAPSVTFNTLTASGADAATVAEDAEPGTFVSHVIVTDPDASSNGQTHCNLVSEDGDSATPFSLEQMFDTEYQLVTTGPLDRELIRRYSVTLLCRDGGVSPLSTTVRLQIDVTDVNDNCPVFHSSSPSADGLTVTYVAELLENNFVGVFVSQVNASDLDSGPNGVISYILTDDFQADAVEGDYRQKTERRQPDRGSSFVSRRQDTGGKMRSENSEITDVCSDKFAVDSMSGVVTAKTSLDFEQQASYRCRLLAVDDGTPPQTAEALLIVNVVDVNDERPRFQLEMYTFYVPENRPPGTHVGTVSATDADSPPFNQFTFSMLSAGSLSDAFQMDATSGKLSTTRPLDRERQDVYHLIVVAKDGQSPDVLTSTAAVAVYVTDVNDNSPVFTSSADSTVVSRDGKTSRNESASSETESGMIIVSSHTRHGTVVSRVKAVDADVGKNAQISYSMQTAGSESRIRFSIDSHNGAIILSDRLTSDDVNLTHRLLITAVDAGLPALSATTQLLIKIVDGSSLPGGASGHQTSPLSRYDARSHHIFVNYGIVGLVAIIILSIATVTVLILIVIIVAYVVRKRRQRRFASKSVVHQESPLVFSPPLDGSIAAVSTTSVSEKYNCRVEAMKALNAVNHWDVGVANCSKTMIRPMNTSPRQAASGRVTLLSNNASYEAIQSDIQSADNINKSKYATTPFCTDVDYHCRTVDSKMTTFRNSPSHGHVSNNYWTYGNKRPVVS